MICSHLHTTTQQQNITLRCTSHLSLVLLKPSFEVGGFNNLLKAPKVGFRQVEDINAAHSRQTSSLRL